MRTSGQPTGEGARTVLPSGEPGQPPAPEADLDLTLVLPYFNPGPALRTTVEEVAATLGATGASFEIIAVSDGSTDGSERSIEGLFPESLVQVVLPGRRGKGEALRSGFKMGRGRYIGFIDADGDIPPQLLGAFVDIMRAERPDIILGSKRHPASQVVYPLMRRLYSWAYQQAVRWGFGLHVTDTQAGIKLVRREVLAEVLPRTVVEGFAFDLELLVLAHRLGYRAVVEAPVEIRRRFSSTISLRAVMATTVETAGIWWRLHVTRAYRL
ncbi:MAG: glycosyltransferase [Acidobacteriota bacterium]|nr:glycosyltransferase [Acidobacteriota bacterium]